ncbi:MAG: VanW family protein [Paenibacillus dendritiformis]|uniref:VanW family protein n=1 Tax=uncultured Paenibacillus sp. TaxID=227322 RepID=UPI0025FD0A3D|nr:VanW family protein [uncultured Paenibacillus sp.]MDU5144432.1 VanW family protein [Paenibacillus dendritiformis]
MITRPKPRSKLRITLGMMYFRGKRHLKWIFGRTRYAGQQQTELLPYEIFRHETPVYRNLPRVDRWLQDNKKINLQIALKKLNGIVIHPGETFSYWKLIGKPTRRKGYVDGMVLFYGGFKTGIGGGLCQLSNLIYWTALHTPLQVTERHRHSYDVFPDSNRTQPFGSGATCVYNYLDLQIYNPTEEPYQLQLALEKDRLIGRWRSAAPQKYRYEIVEKGHRITQEHWGGYVRHNQIFRRQFNRHGEKISEQLAAENHALMMYAPLLAEAETRGGHSG